MFNVVVMLAYVCADAINGLCIGRAHACSCMATNLAAVACGRVHGVGEHACGGNMLSADVNHNTLSHVLVAWAGRSVSLATESTHAWHHTLQARASDCTCIPLKPFHASTHNRIGWQCVCNQHAAVLRMASCKHTRTSLTLCGVLAEPTQGQCLAVCSV
jgi:hypothetical protein